MFILPTRRQPEFLCKKLEVTSYRNGIYKQQATGVLLTTRRYKYQELHYLPGITSCQK